MHVRLRCKPCGQDDFRGDWLIRREITDHLAGQTGWFSGQASFTPDQTGLRYFETGTLKLAAQPEMTATRRYVWRFLDEHVDVAFEDGRHFHSFHLSDPTAEAAHFCDPDDYEVAYDFGKWPNWRVKWTVKGPRKDYVMMSEYTCAHVSPCT